MVDSETIETKIADKKEEFEEENKKFFGKKNNKVMDYLIASARTTTLPQAIRPCSPSREHTPQATVRELPFRMKSTLARCRLSATISIRYA